MKIKPKWTAPLFSLLLAASCLNSPGTQNAIPAAAEETVYVIPCGETAGVKLYTEGILVVGVASIIDESGKEYSPAEEAGIKEGDIITAVNSQAINSIEEFSLSISSGTSALLTLRRSGVEFTAELSPVRSAKDGVFRAGIWVRDSAAGIGTITYCDPSDGSFAGLGHAVADPDTNDILTLREGALVECSIISVSKGEAGEPGELNGGLMPEQIGSIEKNSSTGIYGTLTSQKAAELAACSAPIPAASRREIKKGYAEILADLGNGVQPYAVSILRYSLSSHDNKGIVFEVCDEKLLEITGGIIQGMSGAPIIQNGKFIGAVTHVLVNDPQKGYGVFADTMLAGAE